MVRFRAFRALHYDPKAVGDLAAVIAPPYDVIDDAYRDRLYERSPFNVIRLILNRDADRYASSAAHLGDWKSRRLLVRDEKPAVYLYEQDFALPRGGRRRRTGFIAAVHLEPFAAGNIRPHERTFPKAKEDRLKLVRACRTNLSPLFGVYAGHADVLAAARGAAAAPWIDLSDDCKDRHRVWRIEDPAVVARMQAGLADTTVLIADGHHRYETSLAYRDERRAAGDTRPDAPHEFVLMYLTSMDEPGLVVLPTHRVWRGDLPEDWLGRLEKHFEVVRWGEIGAAEAIARLDRESARGCLAVSFGAGETALLRLRDPAKLDDELKDVDSAVRRLDVTVLDGFVLGRLLGIDGVRAAQEGLLGYTHDDEEALASVRRGAKAVFLLRTPHMSEVEAVCLAGQTMPQKSTYFYPKLLSGLVFHPLD